MEPFTPSDLCEDLVCCVICFEPFNDTRIPKALPCLHTFCSECLQGSIDAYINYPRKDKPVSHRVFPCPICKENVRIPENGMKGFKDDFRIRRISEYLSKVNNSPTEVKKFSFSGKKCDVCKFFNKDIPAPLFCLECSKMLCNSCSEKHLMMSIAKNHNIIEAKDTITPTNEATCTEHVGEVMRYFCRDCNKSLCTTCTFTDDHSNHNVAELMEEGKKVKNDLTELIATCRRKLPEIKTALADYDSLEQKVMEKEKTAKRAILLWALQEMTRIRKEQSKMEEELQTMSRTKTKELQIGRQKTQEHQEELSTNLDLMDRMVKGGQDTQLVSTYTETSSRLRTLAAFKTPSPPQEGAVSDFGKYDNLIEQFELELSKDLKETGDTILEELRAVAIKMQMVNSNQGQVKIKTLARFGKRGPKEGEFHFPAGVAFSPVNGDIVIADLQNSRIQVFNKDGKFLHQFGQENFKPCGVVVRKNGDIVVTDTCNHVNCIKVFSATGSRKQTYGHGEFDYPFCIALDSKERFVVSDSAKNEIVIIDDRGHLWNRFPTRTKFAFYLAVNSKDQILSSDWYHHCIRVFDMKGSLLQRIGSRGFDNGQLMIPLGICTDSNDHVYILDVKCQRVAVFTSENSFVRNILDNKQEGIEFARAIALSNDGRLVITQGDNKRDIPNEVRIYQLEM